MEDNLKQKIPKLKIAKWSIIGALTLACLVGIILEAVWMGNATQETKLGAIHIAQYALMIVCIFLPIILEALKLKVGIYVWIAFYLFVFFAVFVGSILNIYDRFAGFDIIMHTASGVLLALLALSFTKNIPHPFVVFLFAVGFATLIGVLWEFYEFSFDWLMNLNMQRTHSVVTGEALSGRAAILDTMLDLFCDFAGAVVAAIFGTIFRKQAGSKLRIEKR